MGFFDAFNGDSQRRDLRWGRDGANRILNRGEQQARGELNTGFDRADQLLGQSGEAADRGYVTAEDTLRRGQDGALGYLDPYVQSGTQANTLYGNALGLNGVSAQQGFGDNYAASDPFRAQNADFATEALMRAYNARGQGGGGVAAEAVARQNLMRGSEDYNNYLNRLSGVRDSGQQAATTSASLLGDFSRMRAGNAVDRGNASQGNLRLMAGNATERGNALSNLSYGHGQQLANVRLGSANAISGTRSTGINNLFRLGELNVNAARAAMGGGFGG